MQKLREKHETIQQLTSQLQQMQKQMNSMSDSGDFQDVESNNSGRLCNVSRQPVMIPSSRSLLSRDKRLPLDTWNQSGSQENVFFWGNKFLRLIHPEIILKFFNLTTCKETEKPAPEAERMKTSHTSEADKLKAQFQCRQVVVWTDPDLDRQLLVSLWVKVSGCGIFPSSPQLVVPDSLSGVEFLSPALPVVSSREFRPESSDITGR